MAWLLLQPISKTNDRKAVPETSPDAARSASRSPRKMMFMTAQTLVGLIEEMMDLKLQQYAESQIKLPSEVAPLLREKRETDRRRLDQIKLELVRFLES
jgi:hypothetical protein